jgi:acetylornithine deacetylase/succinyl-diaminopimelate desuccinylase-like protein
MENSIIHNQNLNSSTSWEKINLGDSDSDITAINPDDITNYINDEFEKTYKPSLKNFIRIPNLSPAYDPTYKTNGFQIKAAEHLKDFADNCGIIGLNSTIFNNGNTPLLWIMINSTIKTETKSVLMYGHFDKQPPFTGWDKDKSSTNPVEENGRLYGRGSTDDGYALYSCLLSIRALQHLNIPHPKIKIMIEGDEESGSTDLVEYLGMDIIKVKNKIK